MAVIQTSMPVIDDWLQDPTLTTPPDFEEIFKCQGCLEDDWSARDVRTSGDALVGHDTGTKTCSRPAEQQRH